MSKRPHSDTSDVVARARAAIAAKYAKLSTEHKSPKAGSTETTPAPSASRSSRPPEPPGSRPVTSPRPPGSASINPDLQKRIAEATARAAAQAALVQRAREAEREEALGGTEQERHFDPRGGLEMGLHPALQGDLMLANKRSSQRSRFATTIANKKPEEVRPVAKGKQLELLSGPDESFTDREKNPYFDPKLGGRDTTRPTDRRSKALLFSEPGKYIDRANRVRAEESLKALQARIAATARRAGLEDDLDVSGRAIAREEPPEIEWWDAPYTKHGTYEDIDSRGLKIFVSDSPITVMIQHPIPIPAPADLNAPAPAPLMYTKKEHKKIRNQERAAKQKDKQDKQRLGLIPPEAPKVKLSNMATVLAHSTIQDPTKVEREVRAQVQARRDQHEQMNEERKLTHDEKKAKAAQKLAEDEARGIRAAAWRVETMANGYNRRRVDENAQQCGLTGVVVLNPRFNLVYVEGGAKSIKFFKRLIESRIEWTEEPRSAATATDDVVSADGRAEARPDYAANRCTCVWEGELKKRAYGAFRYKKCEYEVDVKEALKNEIYPLWNIAKGTKEE